MQEKEKTFEPVLNLEADSRKRSLALAVVIAVALTFGLLELLGFGKTTFEYWLRFLVGTVALFYLIYLLVLFLLSYQHKCPKCLTKWSFQKVKEIIQDSYMIQQKDSISDRILNYRIERYNLEYKCSECGYIKDFPKKRKTKVS